ncbi:MAG: hypothetical protein ABI723_22855 [Bacteroidia bacterium]
MNYTKRSLVSIALLIALISLVFDLWNYNRITIDAPSYYAYLPSTFIYHDLKLNYVNNNPDFFHDKIWFQTTSEGKRLIKSTYGMSVALSPFFFIGHFIAPLFGYPQDGYSLPYQNAMSIGVLIYLFIGLYFLSKTLLNYFSDKAVALTLFTIVIGTNLLWYATFEGLMNHTISFSFLCICIYLWNKWITEDKKKHLILFTVMFVLVVLIRSLSIMLFLYFLIAGVMMKGGLKNFFLFLKSYQATIIICLGIILLMISPQLLYWKYATGHWMVDAYIDEHFFFSQPYFFSFLFSFRKGWFVYTPVMFIAALGLILLYKKQKPFFYATLISVTVTAYIFSSWWAWSYGICWGMRPMIDSYTLMSFPLAAAFSFMLERKKIISNMMLAFVFLLIMLNLFQTWQYKNGLIHYDDMSREAYMKGFFQTSQKPGWYDALKPFDWERRRQGLPEIKYSKQFFDNLNETTPICLRGYNLCYLSSSSQSDYIITCNYNDIGSEELFYLFRFSGDTVAFKSSNGKFLSVKNDMKGMLVADANSINDCEKFIFHLISDDDNRIALKACNQNYLSVTLRFPNIVGAVTDSISKVSTFRVFVQDKK